MTISTTTNRVSYTGNGTTTVFSFPYKFLAAADLVVVKRLTSTGVETVQALTSDYTVSGTGLDAGGSVTMISAPASTYKLIIYRDATLTQDLDLVENDPLPAEELEKRLDKLTIFCQRLKDRVDRAVRLTDGFTPSFTPTLPVDVNTANSVLVVNATGDGIDIGPTTTQIADAEADADEAAASAVAALASQVAAAASAAAAAIDVLSVTGTSSAPVAVVAGTALAVAATVNHKKYIQGSGGAVVVSANPQITAGTRDGQWLLLIGSSDTNTVKYANGTGLNLKGYVILKQNDCLWLSWDNTASVWTEVSRALN